MKASISHQMCRIRYMQFRYPRFTTFGTQSNDGGGNSDTTSTKAKAAPTSKIETQFSSYECCLLLCCRYTECEHVPYFEAGLREYMGWLAIIQPYSKI